MSIIVSSYPSSSFMRGMYYRRHIVKAITAAFAKGFNAVEISPLKILQDSYSTLRFVLKTRISKKIEILEEPDVLAHRMLESRISRIDIESDARPEHILELVVQLLSPPKDKSIRDFNRPHINIEFAYEKPSAAPPPAQRMIFVRRVDQFARLKDEKDFPKHNPFQNKSLQEIWQVQSKYKPGRPVENPRELYHLIEWLSFMLKSEEHGIHLRWRLLYDEGQISVFREKVLPKLRSIKKKGLAGTQDISFEKKVRKAFERMSADPIPEGAFYASVFPVKSSITSIPSQWSELTAALDLDLDRDFSSCKAIFECLKNASAHGGEALVVARRYQDYKRGKLRLILEVIVWDNGPGIRNLRQALQPGYSTHPGFFNSRAGWGKGLDLIVGYEDIERTVPRYTADELVIETGQQKVERKNNTDSYHFTRLVEKIPGTKITLRFWF